MPTGACCGPKTAPAGGRRDRRQPVSDQRARATAHHLLVRAACGATDRAAAEQTINRLGGLVVDTDVGGFVVETENPAVGEIANDVLSC